MWKNETFTITEKYFFTLDSGDFSNFPTQVFLQKFRQITSFTKESYCTVNSFHENSSKTVTFPKIFANNFHNYHIVYI